MPVPIKSKYAADSHYQNHERSSAEHNILYNIWIVNCLCVATVSDAVLALKLFKWGGTTMWIWGRFMSTTKMHDRMRHINP